MIPKTLIEMVYIHDGKGGYVEHEETGVYKQSHGYGFVSFKQVSLDWLLDDWGLNNNGHQGMWLFIVNRHVRLLQYLAAMRTCMYDYRN